MSALWIVVAVVAVVAGTLGYSRFMDRRAADAWATTQGVIVESRTEARHEANADRPNVRYGARVAYEYTVNGKPYRSERVSYAGTLWRATPDAAEADRARYAVGQSVRVLYDPQDPARAVLETVHAAAK